MRLPPVADGDIINPTIRTCANWSVIFFATLLSVTGCKTAIGGDQISGGGCQTPQRRWRWLFNIAFNDHVARQDQLHGAGYSAAETGELDDFRCSGLSWLGNGITACSGAGSLRGGRAQARKSPARRDE